VEDSPVANVVLTFAARGGNWSGEPLELYHTIAKMAGDRLAIGKLTGGQLTNVKIAGGRLGARWPKSVSTFGNERRRIAPQVRLHGVSTHFERSHDGRVVTLKSEKRKKGTRPLDDYLGCCKAETP
jgi:hypothetical protein